MDRGLKCDHSLESRYKQYFTLVLFAFQFSLVCICGRFIIFGREWIKNCVPFDHAQSKCVKKKEVRYQTIGDLVSKQTV